MTTDVRYAFEITLHARPDAAGPGTPLTDAWGTWPTLAVSLAALATPLACDFDEALERLARIERLFAEPDGSFVWTTADAPGPDAAWQVDGNAYERAGRVLHVDMKGSCPGRHFDRLLEAFGWPGEPMMMQLVRPAVFLEEATFRRHALTRGLAGDGETLRPSPW